jgi:hypothetical protein
MKNVILALIAALYVSTSAMADEAKTLFQYNNATLLGGEATRLSLRDNGDIHLYRGRACLGCRPSFDAVIDRLDARAMEEVKDSLALLKPNMKLRALSPREKKLLRMCAMDSGVNYVALGSQFERGYLVVWQAQGCGVNAGLADKRAERAMSDLRAILDKALEKHRNN